jgi:phosphoribosylformimino-5-aminoimidazole carboxamide ribotide isomerase
MIIIPAIDLQGGKCVRLRQGREHDVKVYSGDPVAMARHWEAEGARYLHVVDLDGAFQGRPAHTDTVRAIASAIAIPVEVGGGLRSDEDIRSVLEAGAARAIIGTRAFTDPDGMARLVERHGARIAVGIDARAGFVQVKGWVETTGLRAVDLALRADRMGVATLICTDTATDGMMRGTNTAAIDEICAAVKCAVVASGGVTTLDDVRALRALGRGNLAGVIVGKALYEGAFRLDEAE